MKRGEEDVVVKVAMEVAVQVVISGGDGGGGRVELELVIWGDGVVVVVQTAVEVVRVEMVTVVGEVVGK